MSTRKPKHSSNYWCVVPGGCTSDSRKKNNLIKYPWMENVIFIAFPTSKKNKTLRQKWVEMIRRLLVYEPLAHHRVYSRYFVQDSNVPELFQWNNYREYDPHQSLASIVKRNSDINAGEVPEPTVDVNNNHEPEAETLVITNEQPRGSSESITPSSYPVVVNDGTRDRYLHVMNVNIDVTTSNIIEPEEVVNNQQDNHSYSRASTSTGTMCSTFIDTGRQQKQGLDVHNENGELQYYPVDQTQSFSKYFEDLALPKDKGNDPEFLDLCNVRHKIIEQLCEQENLTTEFSTQNICDAIKQLHSGKATDELGLAAEHFKNSPAIVTQFLTDCFNTIMKDKLIPHIFKSGIVIPVLKKREKSNDDGQLQGNCRHTCCVKAL
ncbi:unnamed protein product [Mytilus coruscus]|uniref:Uncharacterized protein n=1 Tax=Mytilus coruscus TaxID=42192 RepID=A0A6J8ANQ2_MYTCO|nr:unnamed protein product [Mytilus coruscus]